MRRDLTFASAGRAVVACSRLGVVATLTCPRSAGRPSRLLLLGDRLYAVAPGRDGGGGYLLAWDIDGLGGDGAPSTLAPCLTLALRRPGARPTALLHPPTYVDKLMIGFDDGGLALWNVGAGALLHTFGAAGDRPRGAVRALAAAPALDVVAAGWDDGSVTLIDARADALLAEFTDAAGGGGSGSGATTTTTGGPVTSLAFSTAGAGAPPLLAVGGARGSIGVWSLEDRTLAGALPRAHAAPVAGLHFFVGEPRLQSAGADNALKQWLFDTGAGRGGGRLAPTAAGAPRRRRGAPAAQPGRPRRPPLPRAPLWGGWHAPADGGPRSCAAPVVGGSGRCIHRTVPRRRRPGRPRAQAGRAGCRRQAAARGGSGRGHGELVGEGWSAAAHTHALALPALHSFPPRGAQLYTPAGTSFQMPD